MVVKAFFVLIFFLFLAGCTQQQGAVEKEPLTDIAETNPVLLQEDDTPVNVAAGMDSPAFVLAALINDYRAGHDRKVMYWESELYQTAMAYTQALLVDPTCLTQATPMCAAETDLETLSKAQGFTGFVDKNVRITTRSKLDVQATFDDWMNSAPHKRVIDDKRFNAVGVAIVKLGNTTIYTMVFGQAS